jgi:UV DNA damage repair endonuclease
MTTIKRADERLVHDNDHQVPFSPSMAWMPLEGVAHQWAKFAGTFLSAPAFTATAEVFSALSLETEALQQYNEACQGHSHRHILSARDLCEQVVRDLHKASDHWMHVLFELERLASDTWHPLDTEEHAALRRFFCEATKHLQRVGVLTQQMQAACVLEYQQHGILGHEEEEEGERP